MPISAEEVKAFEEEFWVKFPKGYLEYITNFGEGVLAETIRIYPPRRIKEELPVWRQRIKDYWFWNEEPRLLPKERALEAIVLGDTLNGDELIFHPSFPEKIFILPHEDESVILAGDNLPDVIQEIFDDVKENTEFELNFEPYDSRNIERNFNVEFQSPEGESIEELMNRIEEWKIRNFTEKQAEKMLAEYLKPNYEAKFVSEGIYLKTENMDIGYFINYEIFDMNNGEKIGIFRFNKNSQSYGGGFD